MNGANRECQRPEEASGRPAPVADAPGSPIKTGERVASSLAPLAWHRRATTKGSGPVGRILSPIAIDRPCGAVAVPTPSLRILFGDRCGLTGPHQLERDLRELAVADNRGLDLVARLAIPQRP